MKRTPNIALLRKVKAAILKHPSQFLMHQFFDNRNSVYLPASGCGTAACIAGWAIHLSKDEETLGATSDRYYENPFPEARAALGLSINQGLDLANASFWPQPFRKEWQKALTARAKAKVAAQRIDHFIKHELTTRLKH